MSSLSNIHLPKPKDWQDFERKTWALFAHVLADPNTQMHGRTGQPQHGVDIWGYRNKDPGSIVGVQCKLSNDAITAAELNAELERAKSFVPPISEFFLVTTAARDSKIQQTARELTRSLAGTGQPMFVGVWGWDDVEESAADYADAWKIFDPTFNPFAEQARDEARTRFDSLDVRLESINSKQRSEMDAMRPSPWARLIAAIKPRYLAVAFGMCLLLLVAIGYRSTFIHVVGARYGDTHGLRNSLRSCDTSSKVRATCEGKVSCVPWPEGKAMCIPEPAPYAEISTKAVVVLYECRSWFDDWGAFATSTPKFGEGGQTAVLRSGDTLWCGLPSTRTK